MFAIISVIILTVALWILYHKLFRVVYFDAITAVFREFVICLVIAILIVLGISRAIGSVLPQEGELSYDTASASWTTRFPEGILYVHLYTGFVELCQDFVFEESDFNISGVYYV